MVSKIPAILVVLVCLLFVTYGHASDCMDSAVTQLELNSCAYQKAREASELLQILEKEIRHSLESGQQDKFSTAQEAWRVMMDNDCDIEASFYEGGSAQPMVRFSCEAGRTNARIKQTLYYLCPEWGMTGNCPAEKRYSPLGTPNQ